MRTDRRKEKITGRRDERTTEKGRTREQGSATAPIAVGGREGERLKKGMEERKRRNGREHESERK